MKVGRGREGGGGGTRLQQKVFNEDIQLGSVACLKREFSNFSLNLMQLHPAALSRLIRAKESLHSVINDFVYASAVNFVLAQWNSRRIVKRCCIICEHEVLTRGRCRWALLRTLCARVGTKA